MTKRLYRWIPLLALAVVLPGMAPAQEGQVEPTKAERMYQRAEEMIGNARYLDAAEQLQLALDEDPSFLDARKRLGFVYTRMAESDPDYYEDALETYEELELDLPDDVDVKRRKAFVFTKLDELENALDVYAEITDIDPEDCDAWGKIGGLQRALAAQEMEGTDEQYAHYEEALVAFRSMPESCEDKGTAYNEMGEILYGMGRTQDAADVYATLLDQNPENIDIAGKLGYLWFNAGQDVRKDEKDKEGAKALYAKAVPYLERVMELDPDALNYMGLLANSYKYAGMPEKAAPIYLKLIESDDSMANQYCSLGFLYIDMKDHEQAINMAMKAISENAPQPGCLQCIWGKALELRALALEQEYRFSQALSTYAEAKNKFTQALADAQWSSYATKQITRIDQLIERCRQLKLQDEQGGSKR